MRHGETESNILQIYQGQGDGILSKKGKLQAQAASKYFAKKNFDAIYCSDLSRSINTAKIVGKKHKVPIKISKDLRERFYGDWEGLRFNEIDKNFKKLYRFWLKNPNKAKIPYAETLLELQKRGVRAIKKIVKKEKGKTVLIVGHGGINRAIIFFFLGLDLNSFWKISQNNCCYNVIEFKKPYPRVTVINNTCYLDKKFVIKKNVLI